MANIGCLLMQSFTLSKIVRFLSPFLFRSLLFENIINIFPFFLSASKALIELSGGQEGSYALKYSNYFYVSRARIGNSNSAGLLN